MVLTGPQPNPAPAPSGEKPYGCWVRYDWTHWRRVGCAETYEDGYSFLASYDVINKDGSKVVLPRHLHPIRGRKVD